MKKLLVSLICGLFFLYLLWANKAIEVTSHEHSSSLVGKDLDGYVIVHLSDLHNQQFKNLTRLVEEEEPDVIFITGDLIDRRKYKEEVALSTVKDLVKIAPVYYVPGNHEAWSGKYESFREKLLALDLTLLENETKMIQIGKDKLYLTGLLDPGFEKPFMNLKKYEDGLQVILAHRPEDFPAYQMGGADLVFSGHTHGGQVRLPLIGGIIAPNQGLLPTYDSGVFERQQAKMFLSRGLGNSIIPIRVFNRPQIIVVTLLQE